MRNIDTTGFGIKTTISFVVGTITKEDTLNTTARQLVWNIITKVRKIGAPKDTKRVISRRMTIETCMGSVPIESRNRKKINEINRCKNSLNLKGFRSTRGSNRDRVIVAIC